MSKPEAQLNVFRLLRRNPRASLLCQLALAAVIFLADALVETGYDLELLYVLPLLLGIWSRTDLVLMCGISVILLLCGWALSDKRSDPRKEAVNRLLSTGALISIVAAHWLAPSRRWLDQRRVAELRALQDRQDEIDLLEAVVDFALPTGLLVVNRVGKIRYVNQLFRLETGYTTAELKALQVSDIVSGTDDILERAFQLGEKRVQTYDVSVRLRDGGEKEAALATITETLNDRLFCAWTISFSKREVWP